MLDRVRGIVEEVTEDGAVIGVGGAGLLVEMPTPDLSSMNGDVTVFTVLQIREEEVHLYGFATQRGRELFRALTSVGGVGPKLALAILSFHPVAALERAIAAGDADALSLVSGVGKKTAGRIVLELRDKLGVAALEPVATADRSALVDVREALKGLGYSAQEIQDVVAALPPDGDAPTLLRHALKTLGRAEPAGVQ
ncbi:MAG TPA: Holliday junction branch migration protein RuvA [Actinomycetota bacterium]|nr:Holliday junction branch migration protein RuvA [Actinomycetota bacterium]